MKMPINNFRYTYEVGKLGEGCNLGNMQAYTHMDQYSNCLGFWCSDDKYYLGMMRIGIKLNGKELVPDTTTFAPAYQSTAYRSGDIHVDKLMFIPYGCGYLRTLYSIITVGNHSPERVTLDVTLNLRYQAVDTKRHFKNPSPDSLEEIVEVRQEKEIFLISNSPKAYAQGLQGDPNKVRIIGSSLMPESHTFTDPGKSTIHYKVTVDANSVKEVPVFFIATAEGENAARSAYQDAINYEHIFNETIKNMDRVIQTSDVVTPDPLINRGIAWSKVNTARVQHEFPAGYGFTNNPPQDIIVMRDAGWYMMGNNYLNQDFSKGLVELIDKYGCHEGGKITEFIRPATEPVYRTDYDLNINDNTPLIIMAVYHYYCLTQDREFLEKYYHIVENAADWILSQMKDGLVFTRTNGTFLWGISGWRNVIYGYNINGYVTEINSECFQALTNMAQLAEVLGNSSKAEKYFKEAELLKDKINSSLISDETGLYSLVIDMEGKRRDEITSDLIFPVMFNIPTGDLSDRILELLYSPQFWTDFGCRTVGNEQPEYDPQYGYNLMGGIWPNSTAWIGYAFREKHPERLVESLRNIYRISEVETPAEYEGVCPGEFPERLNGDTYRSEGMKASPWMPPTYIWLAMEGLAGIEARADALSVQPHLPDSWDWIGVRNVPYKNGFMSYFLWEGTLYTDANIQSGYPVEQYEKTIPSFSGAGTYSIAFYRGEEVAVLLYAYEDFDGELDLELPDGSNKKVQANLAANNADIFRVNLSQV